VAQGQAPGGRRAVVGITDTDDALEEIKDGKPLAMILSGSDRPKGDRLARCSFRTASPSQGIAKSAAARQLVDYLLSAKSRQSLRNGRQPSDSTQSQCNGFASAANGNGRERSDDGGRL